MALSEGCVKSVMNTMRAEFGLRLNIEKDADVWQRRLREAKADDGTLPGLYREFVRTWPHELSKPSLRHLVRFCRMHYSAPRPERTERDTEPPCPPEVALAYIRRMRKRIRALGRGFRPDYLDDGSLVKDVPDGEIPF